MKKPNNKKQNNGGILSAIAALFKGGAAAGGASGAAVTSGIFATKAGMLGLLLGGATIAAGVGAVYHLAGGSATKTAYSPELFQNSYYEEQAAIAEAERNQNNDRRASVVNSTIDMFSASARQSGYFDQGSSDSALSSVEMPDGSDVSMAGSSSSAEASASSSVSSAVESGSSTASGSTKLAYNGSSFGGAGSGSNRVSSSGAGSMGALKAGMGKNFNPKMASAGKSSAMAANMSKKVSSARGAAKARGSKRAFSQAKFANNMSKKAVASGSFEASRTAASSAFTGEAAGGDAGDSVEGVGMDTSGMAVGTALKNGTPNGNSNLKSVPPVSESENASPWKDLVKKVATLSLVAMGLFLLGKVLAKMAKNSTQPWLAGVVKAIAVVLAIIGAFILGAAVTLATKYGQKMYGILYGLAGGLCLWEAYNLWNEADESQKLAEQNAQDEALKKQVAENNSTSEVSSGGEQNTSSPSSTQTSNTQTTSSSGGNNTANTSTQPSNTTTSGSGAGSTAPKAQEIAVGDSQTIDTIAAENKPTYTKWGWDGLVNDVDMGDIGKKIESGIASSVTQQAIGDVSDQSGSAIGGSKNS